MTREMAGLGATLAAVVLTATLVAGASPPVAATIAASPTSDVPVSVIIPGPTASPTTTSSPSPSSSSGTGGNTSGGTGTGTGTGAGTDTGCIAIGTNPDGSPIPPAQATDDAAALTLDKPSYAVRDWMIATATGFTPGEEAQFVLYPGAVVLDSFTVDAGGTVTARIRVPEDTRPGQHVLEANGWGSCHVANREFTVTSTAAVVPWLWWVIAVLGVLLAGLIALAIYFRESIRGWFGGGVPVAEVAP